MSFVYAEKIRQYACHTLAAHRLASVSATAGSVALAVAALRTLVVDEVVIPACARSSTRFSQNTLLHLILFLIDSTTSRLATH